MQLKITRRAAVEIADASSWWRDNRPAAPNAVAEELRHTFALLRSAPGAGAPARNTKLEGVRRVLLGRIRYHVYYRVDADRRVVEVLALWHANRGAPPEL